MAARVKITTKIQQDQTRAAIKTTQLIKRLQSFALGESEVVSAEGEDPKSIEIDSGRLKAIEILLRKSLPDLAAITLSGDADNPIYTKETGTGALKIANLLASIAERSRAASPPDPE